VNRELNLGHYNPGTVQLVRDWFDQLWEEANPFDLAAIYEARYEPHNPYVIYLRMLYERYGRELQAEAEDTGTRIRLAQFLKDGLWRARRILNERHGVLIADGVGLGKTFLGGELIREVVQQRRQRVLLVAPASLRDGTWRHFLLRQQLGVECISYEQLAARELQFRPEEYSLIVIDEGHAFRNPETLRAGELRWLLQGTPPKDVVFLTATPVNNSLWDLYYLLGYFMRNDAAFAHAGIRSLKSHFQEAMALDPDDLSPDKLFDILDEVAVRRTRHFVKRYYPNDRIEMDGRLMPIVFPKPETRRVNYDFDALLPGLFPRFAHALDCADGDCQHSEPAVKSAPVLRLARYVPSRYRKGADGVQAFELQLAGLLRSGLLKRFESSVHAFATTCERMADSHDSFLGLIQQGFVATGETLAEWAMTDSDEFEEFLARQQNDLEPLTDFESTSLRADVESDRDLLRAFAAEARAVSPADDPKLEELRKNLMAIAAQAADESIGPQDERDKRKVLLFSYFADTVEWIKYYLESRIAADASLEAYRNRWVVVSGNEGDRAEAMYGFSPITTEAPPGKDVDRYDILVSTDVLAEGVNLQQARHVINFDLPWNPMRLVQRHGRIDRIGSSHPRVFIHCFFPDRQLEELLGLEERLHIKIKQAAAAVGVESEPLPGSKVQEVTFADTRQEIERLQAEDSTLFETGGEGTAFSGEEYRQELRQGFEDSALEQLVKSLPWGSGSGMARGGAGRGFVFCARVGDHESPQFRYVDFEDPTNPVAVDDTLTCFAQAHATPDTERVLDEETHRLAYDAWAVARNDILDSWLKGADPANLQPAVPKTMRDAAGILRTHPPGGQSQEEVDRLVNALEAPYGPKIQRAIREAIRSTDDARSQAVAIAEKARELGLQPSAPPEPLPVISLEDVNLVCWMAIEPTDGGSAGEEREWPLPRHSTAPSDLFLICSRQSRRVGLSSPISKGVGFGMTSMSEVFSPAFRSPIRLAR
jgi:superfamily II DNA or RNA helicase